MTCNPLAGVGGSSQLPPKTRPLPSGSHAIWFEYETSVTLRAVEPSAFMTVSAAGTDVEVGVGVATTPVHPARVSAITAIRTAAMREGGCAIGPLTRTQRSCVA